MLFSLLALAKIRSLAPELDSHTKIGEPGNHLRRGVSEETDKTTNENCEDLTSQSVKEFTFTPSSNYYCFTTNRSFLVDGSNLCIIYSSKQYPYFNATYVRVYQETIIKINHTFVDDETNYKATLFFLPDEFRNFGNNNGDNIYIL